jgi:hypothetical protein
MQEETKMILKRIRFTQDGTKVSSGGSMIGSRNL